VNRTLHRAILFSLVLHAAVFFGWSVERISARWEEPPAPLEARLVEPPPPVPSPPPRKEEAVKPPPQTASAAKKAKPRPKPPAVAKPAPQPEPEPEPAPELAAKPEPAPAPPAPALATPAPPVVAKVEPRPMPSSAAQVEAVTREQYRLALIDAARRHNRYPPLARENNWEGEVLVRMDIGADGGVSVRIERSSGHPILDRQAIEMFKRAQAQVPVPSTLRGKTLSFALRAIYNLKDQVSG
jgi:protein TonB